MDETTETKDGTVQVVEEVATVGVRTVDRVGATLRVNVSEHDEVVSRDLFRDTVSVDRVPVGRVVDAAPDVREDGDLTIIPVLEEQLIVTKQLVLVEEIHVRRQRTSVPWTETVRLRKESVIVEPTTGPGA